MCILGLLDFSDSVCQKKKSRKSALCDVTEVSPGLVTTLPVGAPRDLVFFFLSFFFV